MIGADPDGSANYLNLESGVDLLAWSCAPLTHNLKTVLGEMNRQSENL